MATTWWNVSAKIVLILRLLQPQAQSSHFSPHRRTNHTIGVSRYREVDPHALGPNNNSAKTQSIFALFIEPRQSWLLKFRTPRTNQLQLRWFNCVLVARDRPLRLKLTFEYSKDIENEECPIVLKYVLNPWSFDEEKGRDVGSQ